MLIHKASSTVLLGLGYTASLQRSSSNGSGSKDHQQQGARKRVTSNERVRERPGDIRDGRGDASHRQLLKDIENANVLTGDVCSGRSGIFTGRLGPWHHAATGKQSIVLGRRMTAKGNADSFRLRS